LDYYKNLNNVLKAFKKFVSHLGEKGILIANQDNEDVLKIAKGIKKTIFYSLKQKEAALLKLKVPGSYNISNALAALYCARALKIPDKISFKALSEYRGAWRRMETHQAKLKGRNITVISDYGHHPTEIAVTISAIKEKYHGKGIWLIFQPHQYQRTFYLFNDFVRVLNNLGMEKIILAPIYGVAGRETQALIQKISSEKLASKIAMATAMTDFKTIEKYILDKFDKDLLVFMGAGDIYLLAQRFFKNR
jgi:UDP-N-acetylmuramate--alanine ligase